MAIAPRRALWRREGSGGGEPGGGVRTASDERQAWADGASATPTYMYQPQSRRGSSGGEGRQMPSRDGTSARASWCQTAKTSTLAASIASHSYCPSSAWLDTVAPLLPRHDADEIQYLTAGANKGFGVLNMLQRFGVLDGTDRKDGVRSWWRLLKSHAGRSGSRQLCGFCCPCTHPVPPLARAGARIRAHAVEPLHENVVWLRRAVNHFNLSESVDVHAAALTNASHGTVVLPQHMVIGKENVSPHHPVESRSPMISHDLP